MRKLLTALLGFALAVSVASPAAVAGPSVAGPLAQTSPTEGSTLSATKAGTLLSDWVRFDTLLTELASNSSWPSDAEDLDFQGIHVGLETIIVDYFREKLESKSPWVCTGQSVSPNISEARIAMFDLTAISRRSTVYQRLGCPWPNEKYAEWVSFWTSFSSAYYAAAPRVMQYPEVPSLMKDYGSQAEFGAKVGQLLYLHSKLEEQMPSSLATAFATETTKFHNNIALVIQQTVCGSEGKGAAALEALLNGESRRDIYKILGHPWPASRWVTWDQLHKAFTKVNTTQI